MKSSSLHHKRRGKADIWTGILIAPYVIPFLFFIVLPVLLAVGLSFTYYNSVETPSFVGINNYIDIFTKDDVFLQKVLPNTIKFALLVGPFGYVLQFLLAWLLAQIPKVSRTILALIFYSPSLTAGVTMSVMWKVIFSGDQNGYLNSILISTGLIDQPIIWLQSPEYLLPIMIGISLWGSMGVGFLSMMSGILNVDPQLYEAGYVEGVSGKFQELLYITIPSIKPQMLFGAVMAIVATFSSGQIGVQLSGANPTPQYAGQTMISHIEDYGFLQYDMGYAAALSVVLMLMIFGVSKLAEKLFLEKD